MISPYAAPGRVDQLHSVPQASYVSAYPEPTVYGAPIIPPREYAAPDHAYSRSSGGYSPPSYITGHPSRSYPVGNPMATSVPPPQSAMSPQSSLSAISMSPYPIAQIRHHQEPSQPHISYGPAQSHTRSPTQSPPASSPATNTVATQPPERKYICSQPSCGMAFQRSHDLSRHVRSHSGDRPHRCETCEKRFSRRDALKRHVMTKRCGMDEEEEAQ